MAKKGKRSRRKAPVTRTAEVRPQPTSTTAATVLTRAPASAKVDLVQEYSYVFDDLRKIGVIAVVMFVLLFALAFVLR